MLLSTASHVLLSVVQWNRLRGGDVVTAEVISLCDYRKSKQDESKLKNVSGLGYPNDYLVGPDEQSEDFGLLGLSGLGSGLGLASHGQQGPMTIDEEEEE